MTNTLRMILFFAAINISIILSACTDNIAYRGTKHTYSTADLAECNRFGGALEHIGENNADYYLGFVEVDEQGVFFARDQFKNLICELTKYAESSGVLISVFVHGWHHNAKSGDENLKMFKESLTKLSQLEHWFALKKDSLPRKTVGIFVGWQGESLEVEYLNSLTFWERKNTAEKIATRSVLEALLTLEKVRNMPSSSLQPNRLFIVGHSFGADVVYGALSSILLERLINYDVDDCKVGMIKGVGDFVFLINPAFEASQYINFLSLLSEKDTYCENQFPVFAILTSSKDKATKIAFPMGRQLSTLVERYRDMKIIGNNGNDIVVDQSDLDRTAIGHEKILITHKLESNKEVKSTEALGDSIKDECNIVRNLRNGWRTAQEKHVLRDVVLIKNNKYHPKIPYIIIKVDEKIIPDHNRIYDIKVLNFMRRLVVMSTEEEVCAD